MEVTLAAFQKRYQYKAPADLIGKGGFSDVYKAWDTQDEQFVALKIATASAGEKYDLTNEVKKIKKLKHPNLIEYYDLYEVSTGTKDIHGHDLNYQVAVMEYADSGTLGDLLKNKPLTNTEAEELAEGIIDGLAYLHANNIAHRDLKPANILLTTKDGKRIPKITDFGLAKNTIAGNTASTMLLGTVEYMAPEFFKQAEGETTTAAADVWSIGVILLEALTGIHPFGKTTQGKNNEQIIYNILSADLNPSLQNLRAPFKELITRCLIREPKLRPQNAGELKGLLQQNGDPFAERTQVIDFKRKVVSQSSWKYNFKSIFKDKTTGTNNYTRKFISVSLAIVILIGFTYLVLHFIQENKHLVPYYSSSGFVGFKDSKTGEIAIPTNFVYADSFYEGKAKVIVDGKFGFIDKRGKIVIEPIYDDAKEFSEGLAAVAKRNEEGENSWGYIDKDGKEVIKAQYYSAENFKEGLANVSLTSNGRDGIIDKNGNEIIPLNYESVYLTDNGVIKVNNGRGEALFQKNGKQITGFEFDMISENENGLYLVRKIIGEDKGLFNNHYKYGWINREGKEIIPLKYDWASDFNYGVAIVSQETKYYIINLLGETKLLKYDRVKEFENGLAGVMNKTSDTTGLIGFIDKTGKEIIPLIYDNNRFGFNNGIANVMRNGKWGFIDTAGKAICDFEYESVSNDARGYLSVKKDNLYGLMDRKGKMVIPCEYDEVYIDPDEYGRLLAEKNGYCGLIDTIGNIVVPFIYTRNWYPSARHGLYTMTRDSKNCGVLDYEGKCVVGFIENGSHLIRDDQIIVVGHVVAGGVTGSRTEIYCWVNRKGKVIKEFK